MKHLIYSLALLFLVSCSVQKRHYRKGFYIASKSANQSQTVKKQIEPFVKNSNSANSSVAVFTNNESAELLYSTKEKQIPTDSCDVLVFRDGTEILSKITEISELQVRYKRCDNLEGPNYVTDKADLFMIKYGNGTREIMKAPAPKTTIINPAPPKNTAEEKDKLEKYDEPASANMALFAGLSSILMLILSIFLWYFLISSFLSAFRALVAAKKYFSITSREPYAYPGRAKAIAGLILGLITMAVFLVFILVLILVILAL